MDPLLRLWLPAATRGNDMQVRVVLTIATMGLDHDDIAALQEPATDQAEDIIQAPHPTPHERTQHRVGLLIKRFPEDLRHGQDDMAVDDALMEHLADLAHPVVHVDFGTAQAQRRFTAHRDEMFALATVETAVFDRAYLLGIPTPEHLINEAIIVGLIVARVAVFEPVPVLGKDLFEEVPGRRSGCNHQTASLRSIGLWRVTLLYHV